MKILEPITSLTQFVDTVAETGKSSINDTILYRGHARRSYELVPSIFRKNSWMDNEHVMLRSLISRFPKDFDNDKSTFDKLVRAQHFGLPTRLLDMSYNALVGLYFACCSHHDEDGQVIIANLSRNDTKYYDSDTVSCLANLSLQDRPAKRAVFKAAADPDAKRWASIQEFNVNPEVNRLIHFIRGEKPFFQPLINPVDLCNVVAVSPRRTHARIAAQNGAFLLYGLIHVARPGEGFMTNLTFSTIDVDHTSKQQIVRELDALGVSRDTLFPEIENVALEIAKRFS